MSAHLSWMVIRNNNSYLLKKRDIAKPFSREPNNLFNIASFRYNGLVHVRSVGVEPAPDNKGFVLTYKRTNCFQRPAAADVKRPMKGDARTSLHKLRRLLKFKKYRVDLIKAALRRASAILKSQRRMYLASKTSQNRTDSAKKFRTKKAE